MSPSQWQRTSAEPIFIHQHPSEVSHDGNLFQSSKRASGPDRKYLRTNTHLSNLKVVVFCDDDLTRGYPFLVPVYDRTAPDMADLQAACNAMGFWLEIPERRFTEDPHLGQLVI